MIVRVTVLEPFAPFTTKSGKTACRAPCTFVDNGARYPTGRGTVYCSSAEPPKAGKDGLVLDARLISYDRGEARFSV